MVPSRTVDQNRLFGLLEPAVRAMGCELWGIEFARGRRPVLRVYIDKETGVRLEDCERVSRQVSAVLDVEDPIPTEYILEVSSPGLDRPLFTLEQYARFAGAWVAIRLGRAFEGRRNFRGLLVGVEDGCVVVRCEEEEYLFPVEAIERGNLIPRFDGE